MIIFLQNVSKVGCRVVSFASKASACCHHLHLQILGTVTVSLYFVRELFYIAYHVAKTISKNVFVLVASIAYSHTKTKNIQH